MTTSRCRCWTGTFSPGKIAVFDPLSQVPLGPYQPTVAAPASPASRQALGGGDLLPDLNMGGLVTQPVQLITTLAALPTLENSDYTGSAQLARAPISVIRVRVAGVTGPIRPRSTGSRRSPSRSSSAPT